MRSFQERLRELIKNRNREIASCAWLATPWQGEAPPSHCITYIRLGDHERLLPQQWFETIDQLQKNLGLSGQPSAIVQHREGNRGTHLHIVWSRLRANETLAPGGSFTQWRVGGRKV